LTSSRDSKARLDKRLDALIQEILSRPLPDVEPIEPDTLYDADETPAEPDTPLDEEE
jgi:hypothetical protein